MAQTRLLPRICIALGMPDVPTLLDHARREAAAGESLFEFRLDYLDDPCAGANAIPVFLEEFPECMVLATCRRHQNHGRFNGSIEQQLAILDLAVQRGAQAIDVEIETAEAAQERLAQFHGRAQLIVSYHNYEATPPMDTVLNRMMQVPADAYKMVTTARKPSDNLRVLAAAKALPRQPAGGAGHGRAGLSHARAFAGVRRCLHLRRPHVRGRHRGRPGERALPAASLPGGEAAQDHQDFRRDRGPDPALDFAGRA